jgi:hypothetical protein
MLSRSPHRLFVRRGIRISLIYKIVKLLQDSHCLLRRVFPSRLGICKENRVESVDISLEGNITLFIGRLHIIEYLFCPLSSPFLATFCPALNDSSVHGDHIYPCGIWMPCDLLLHNASKQAFQDHSRFPIGSLRPTPHCIQNFSEYVRCPCSYLVPIKKDARSEFQVSLLLTNLIFNIIHREKRKGRTARATSQAY